MNMFTYRVFTEAKSKKLSSHKENTIMNVNGHQIFLGTTYLMFVCCMKSTIKHGSQSLLEAEGVMVAYRVIFIFLYGLLNMSQNLSCGTESKSMSKSFFFFREQRSHKLQKIPNLTQELISA